MLEKQKRLSIVRPPRSFMSARAPALWALLLAALTQLPIAAQSPPASADPGQETPAETAAQAVTAAPTPPPVPPQRRSPRAALLTFLEAFYGDDGSAPDLPSAASVLDLSGIPKALRDRRGRELASQLKTVLDRVERIDLETVPDTASGPPWRLPVHDLGDIVLAADARGDWRFTPETVAAVPELYRQSRTWKLVEGVREAPQTIGMWLRSRLPDSVQGSGFLLETWQWLGLFLLVLIGIALERVVALLLRRAVVGPLARRFAVTDRQALEVALRPAGLLAAGLLWWSGIFWFDLPSAALGVLLVAARLAVALASVWVAYRLADLCAEVLGARAAATESKFDALLAPLVRKSLKVLVVAFGLVFVADNLDLDISSLLAGLGIGGLAVALAAQDIVKNLFGSLMVILDRPFAVGDWVVIDDIEGTVAEVGFRSTRVRTFYNSLVTVPNARLISAAVDNYGARRYRRWSTVLGVTYDTSPDRLEAFCEGIRLLIRQHPDTRKDAFEVHVNTFSASSIDIMLYMFFDTADWSQELAARHRLAIAILRLAKSLGVAFAFPTQTVHLASPGEGASAAGSVPSTGDHTGDRDDGRLRGSDREPFDPLRAAEIGRQRAAGLLGRAAGRAAPRASGPR